LPDSLLDLTPNRLIVPAIILTFPKIQIPCQHLDSKMKNYQLSCALAIITSMDGAASQYL
jgi:hypothetical protein